MRVWLAPWVLLFLTAGLSGETFDLHEHGRLSIYPVGNWIIGSEDMGDYRIRIIPRDRKINATCLIVLDLGGPDVYRLPEKLVSQVRQTAARLLQSGDYIETKAELKTLYRNSGHGCYFTFTNRKAPGKPTEPGNYKQVTFGLIRLSPGVIARLEIQSDDELAEPAQQLIGMVEGMELTTP